MRRLGDRGQRQGLGDEKALMFHLTKPQVHTRDLKYASASFLQKRDQRDQSFRNK